MIRNIAILGSTGSIGLSSLDVVRDDPERFNVVSLACGENIKLLLKQVDEFSPGIVAVRNENDMALVKERFPDIYVVYGSDGILKCVTENDIDTVIVAIPGTITLDATIRSIERGHRICLANKETMVAAGDLINSYLDKSESDLIPVDSEQSAIFQVLEGNRRESLRKVILTASGGPFFKKNQNEFDSITVDEALNHPTWNMGKKISIDSATLMNKALEVIEAKFLFRLAPDQIDVIIHPQSMIHSMVEYRDSSVLAQISIPDMRLPIQYSLNYPLRREGLIERIDLAEIRRMEFFNIDHDKFPSIKMARQVLEQGKDSGLIFNASNEVAVEYFLEGKIRFPYIFRIVDEMINTSKGIQPKDSAEVISMINETKIKTKEVIERKF